MATWGCIQRKSILRVLLPKQSFKEKTCSLRFGFWVSALEVVFLCSPDQNLKNLENWWCSLLLMEAAGWRSWLWLCYVVSFISLLAFFRLHTHACKNIILLTTQTVWTTDAASESEKWHQGPAFFSSLNRGRLLWEKTSSCRQIYTIMCLTRLLLSKDFPDDSMTSSFRSWGRLNYGHY